MVQEFTLGNIPPYISGIKTVPSYKDEVRLASCKRALLIGFAD